MSTKKKLIPKRGAQKQAQPTPLKINKPKSPKAAATKKAPAAAAKAKKPRAKPAPVADAFGADEDEIKLPELAEGEEELPTMGGADSGAGNAESSEELAGKARDEADVPDPFASDDEEAPAAKGETALGKRQRQTLQEEKAAELRKLKSKELARRKAAAAESAKGGQPKSRGVIYVGHIPYGFFESQMKAYFSQFGEVLNIRLSRNKKTGKPKHYAFVEFENEEVARIVAETMNGYFLYGKTLVVKVVPAEKLHPATFVGANRTYRVVPWRQIAQKQHNKPRTPEEAEKRQTRLLQRESAKRKKLAEMGIDYDFKGYKAQEIPKATRVVFE